MKFCLTINIVYSEIIFFLQKNELSFCCIYIYQWRVLENHCNTFKVCLFAQTSKQPISNFKPWKSWKGKQLWGLKRDPSLLQEKEFNKSFVVINFLVIYKVEGIWSSKN